MSSRVAMTGLAALVTMLLLPLSWARAHADWLPNGNPTGASAWWGVDPSVAADHSGGAFVAWGLGICAGIQHFESTGEYATGWPSVGIPTRLCNGQAPVGDRHTRVASDSEGGAYVVSTVWPACVSCQVDPMYILVQRLSGDGHFVPGWPGEGLPAVSLEPWPAEAMLDPAEVPRVVANGGDGVFIAWQAYFLPQFYWGGTVTGPIYVQSIAPDGTRRWGDQGRLVCRATGVHSSPEIVPDGKGGAFVFWCDQRPPDPMGRVFGQHVTASGAISWAPDGIPVSEPYRLRFIEKPRRVLVLAPPFAISDGAHGAIVSWAGARGTDFDIFASRVTYGGGLPWRGDSQVCAAPGDQFDMRMVRAGRGFGPGDREIESFRPALRGGDAIIGWLDSRPDGVRVSAQRLTQGGRIAWASDGVKVGDAEVMAPYWAPRSLLTMAVDGSDGAFFVWPDARLEGGLFAVRISGDGKPACGWPEGGVAIYGRSEALGSADMTNVGKGNAVVAWQNSGGASWATLLGPRGPAATSGGSEIVASLPGERTAPASSLALGLKPGAPDGCLLLSLGDASPATLELFDVMGRKLWSREVGGLRGGEREVLLGGGAMLAPGIYLARVTQGDDRVTARVIIMH